MNKDKLSRPTLLIDTVKCEKNIRRMAEKADREHLVLRPHFKTHQSAEIGEWVRAEGIDRCTVSSVKMAKYFASHGWTDILIAFPVNILEAEKINELAGQIKLQVLVYDVEALKMLVEKTDSLLGIKIELDLGNKRSGLTTSQHEEIDELLRNIEAFPCFQFTGFYSHPGHTYSARSKDEIEKIYEDIIIQLDILNSIYGHRLGFSITVGDTPGCTIADDFGSINEISPGNFVFNDVMQVNIGTCTYDDIAVVMACPVVGKNAARNELLIHAGAVHFSKEVLKDFDGVTHFGKLAVPTDKGWKGTVPDCYLKSISQEHGLIHCSEEFLKQTSIGDVLFIYPVHSCLTANLMKSYLTIDELFLEGDFGFMP